MNEKSKINLEIREEILSWVDSASLRLVGGDEIVEKFGVKAIPALIDIFRNPIDNYGGNANQAVLADALVLLAEKGDEDAFDFLHEIAAGKVAIVSNLYGKNAFGFACEFAQKHPKKN